MLPLLPTTFPSKGLRKVRGVTLLELLIGLAVFAVLLSIAAPNMITFINKQGVQSHIRSLKSDIALARSTAITRSTYVTICGLTSPVTTSPSCVSGTQGDDWYSGWLVFVDDGAGTGGVAADGVRNGSEEVLRVGQYEGSNQLYLVDSQSSDFFMSALIYGPRGYQEPGVKGTSKETDADKLSFIVCDPSDTLIYARALTVELTGRVMDSFDSQSSGIHELGTGADITCAL